MKTYIIKVKNEEVYLKAMIIGGNPFFSPMLTETKDEAGVFEEDKAEVFTKELNKFKEQFDWEWEKLEVEE